MKKKKILSGGICLLLNFTKYILAVKGIILNPVNLERGFAI